jgi:predicted nucleic acid-binding protein
VKIVLDASFAMLWLGKERESKSVSEFDSRVRVGSVELHAPELFLPEISNAVWKSVRRARRTLDEGVQMFEVAMQLPVQLHRHRDLTTAAFDLALRRGLTVYDSLYVALALKDVLPLFTADRKLASSVEDLVEVIAA